MFVWKQQLNGGKKEEHWTRVERLGESSNVKVWGWHLESKKKVSPAINFVTDLYDSDTNTVSNDQNRSIDKCATDLQDLHI